MKEFVIRYEETSVGYFGVVAEDEEGAKKEFWDQVDDGKIDFTGIEVVRVDVAAKPVID